MCQGFGWGFSKSFYCVSSGGRGGKCGWHAHQAHQRELGAKFGDVVSHIVALDAHCVIGL